MKHFIKLCIISIVAIFIHGYQFAVSDQEIFIPYILKSANPSLFQGDALFNQSSAHLSLFYPILGFFIKFIDIQTVFFVGYLIFQVTIFAGIYRLSKILLKNEHLAYFSLLPFFLPKFVGGTATQTFDLFFGHRSVGIIFLIFYLSYLLEKKYLKAFVIAIIGFLIHPLSIIPSALFLPVILLITSKEKIKDSLKIISVCLLLLIMSYMFLGNSFYNSLFIKDSAWYPIIKLRDSYVFMTTWQLLGWAALFIYPAFIFLFYSKIAKGMKKTTLIILMVSLVSIIFNLIILDILKFPNFAQFQLVRSIAPLAYIGLSLSPLLLIYDNKVLKISGAFAFLFLSLNLFYLFLISILIFSFCIYTTKDKKVTQPPRQAFIITCIFIILIYLCLNLKSSFFLQEKLQFPKKEDDWISLQRWVQQNTKISDKFLTPPDKTGFRIFSQRPILGDIKDGAVVVYNSKYAKYWYELISTTQNNDYSNGIKLLRQKNIYDFKYIVSTNFNLNFQRVYINESYALYELNN